MTCWIDESQVSWHPEKGPKLASQASPSRMLRKNPFVQKHTRDKKRRLASAKAVEIASPRSQALANEERVAQSVVNSRERKQRLEAKAEAGAKAKAAAVHASKESAKESAKGAIASVVADGSKVWPAKKQHSPDTESTTRVSTVTQPVTPTTPKPPPKSALSFESLHTAHSAFTSVGFACVLNDVRARRDAAVLCALDDGNGVQTWNSLADTPQSDDDAATNWRKWLAPGNWRSFVDMCSAIDPEADDEYLEKEKESPTFDVAVAAVSGAYNAVLVPSSIAKLDDATKWPPQLLAAGRSGDYVVRITKARAFKSDNSAASLRFRFMRLDDMVLEMALSLYAASLGIGPPVLAAVSWPETVDGSDCLRHGLLLVLGKCRGDMIDFQQSLCNHCPPESYVSGPSSVFTKWAVAAATEVARLCYCMAKEGFLNYDIKPSNLLWLSEDRFFLCDFDPTHFVQVNASTASMKAVFFTNMLLMCMHVRSHSSEPFCKKFLGALAPVVLGLWREAVQNPALFGAGHDWLASARFPVHEAQGLFCAKELRHTRDVGERRRRHLEMIFFEYSFSTSEGRLPPKRCVKWPQWKRKASFFGSPLLVPQILCYCFFFSDTVPDELAAVLSCKAATR